MTIRLKIKLLLFWLISAISFSYLVLQYDSALGITVFYIVQFICLWFVVPDRKRLYIYSPVFIFALNSFISANAIWRVPNIFVSILLFCCMWTKLNIKEDSLKFIPQILDRLADSIEHFGAPFKWILEMSNGKAPVLKRVAVAVLLAIPCSFILILVLSNADMVFSLRTKDVLESVVGTLNIGFMFKIIFSFVFGLFLLGILLSAYSRKKFKERLVNVRKGDLIIINFLLSTVLLIYTAFVIIQFKYLFAEASLPAGLTYTEYARKGFFELLALTCVNVFAILLVVKSIKGYKGKWTAFTKTLCYYLLVVTFVLLASSFYRMLLYTGDDGLTRLRLFVLGFLLFETIGLIITLIYIAKPKFNITLCYFIIALTYYMVLNIIPTDKIVAGNQVNRYINGNRKDIEYVFTLSCDAQDEIKYLLENCRNQEVMSEKSYFFLRNLSRDHLNTWQKFNLSTYRAKKILK